MIYVIDDKLIVSKHLLRIENPRKAISKVFFKTLGNFIKRK